MEGQMSLFDYRPPDKTTDRNGKTRPAPDWYHQKRCENCERWARYTQDEQPPCGWGIYGFCNEHKQRVEKTGYCMNFEYKRLL